MKRNGQTSLAVVRVLLYFPMASQMTEECLLPFERELSTKLKPQYVGDTGYIVLDALIDNNSVILANYYALT